MAILTKAFSDEPQPRLFIQVYHELLASIVDRLRPCLKDISSQEAEISIESTETTK